MSGNLELTENQRDIIHDAGLARALDVGVITVAAKSDLGWALEKFRAKRDHYNVCRNYYAGQQPLAFATEGYKTAFQVMLKRLHANLCPAVISALTDRLEITGFAAHDSHANDDSVGDASQEERAAELAWALWEDNNLTLLADQVHEEAATCGDAYIIVWPDEQGEPQFYANDAADVVVRYDIEDKDKVNLAAKLWREDKRWRMTLYYDDRLEKYQTAPSDSGGTLLPVSANAFTPVQPNGDDSWPLYHEYGSVPVFHFPFMGRIGGDGVSELDDVMPIQDALNKALADLMVNEEFMAYAQRWATGVEKEEKFNAETGKMEEAELPWKVGIDRILTVEDANARFGQFVAGDLDKFTNVIAAHFGLVGKMKGIPPHYFYLITGDYPSGESQRVGESRLTKRAERLQRRFGAIWQQVMTFALTVAREADDTLRIKTQWASAEPRATTEDVTNFKTAIDAGMPIGVAAKRYLNMNDAAIEDMMAEKQQADDAAQARQQAQAERAARMFDAGRSTGGAFPPTNGKQPPRNAPQSR